MVAGVEAAEGEGEAAEGEGVAAGDRAAVEVGVAVVVVVVVVAAARCAVFLRATLDSLGAGEGVEGELRRRTSD